MTTEFQNQIENAREYYEILRTRQVQIISIIKDTTQMLAKLEAQQRFVGKGIISNQQIEKNLDGGVRLAFTLINALANILDEQVKALNVFERMIMEERTSDQRQTGDDHEFHNYYEINSN